MADEPDLAGLVWEEPPRQSDSLVTLRVAILKEHPGKWARYPGKTGPAALRKHGLEAMQRKVGRETHTYVRWPADEQHVAPADAPVAVTIAPTIHPLGRPRPKLSVLLCRQPDCGFETLRDQRRRMESHVLDNHGRAATTVELTPVSR